MAGHTAGGDERWVCEGGCGWGCPWAMVQPWGVPVLDPPQPPAMCQPQRLEWVLGGTGLSPSGSWGSHWGSAPCWEGKGTRCSLAPPNPREKAGEPKYPFPCGALPRLWIPGVLLPRTAAPRPAVPRGSRLCAPPRSCRLRHPPMPKPRAMCHHASPGLKPKPAALSPSPVPSGHGPPRPLPGEGVSSPAGGFLMESRAGMRWAAAAWVAVLACHPLSPAPFFPFRGEKKRGGGGRVETPPQPGHGQARGQLGGIRPHQLP